jgi:hypothetical protein
LSRPKIWVGQREGFRVPQFTTTEAAAVAAMQRMVETTNDPLALIGKRLGVSASTVSRYKQQLGWSRPAGDIVQPALGRAIRQAPGQVGEGAASREAGAEPSHAANAAAAGAAAPEPPAVSAVERRRAVLTRLWAVIEHQTMRIEAGAAGRAQAALSRDVSVLVKTAETLAKVVQNWPPEPPPGPPARTSEEVLADFTARLVGYCEGRELEVDEAEDEPDCREAPRPSSFPASRSEAQAGEGNP